MRRFLGILLGLLGALAIVAAIDWANDYLYPISLDIDSADEATLAAIYGDMPFPAQVLTVLPWLAGAFGGAWLALRICDWRPAGWIVTAPIFALALLDIVDLPHPAWMQVCALILPAIGGWIAQRLHRKPYPGEALLG